MVNPKLRQITNPDYYWEDPAVPNSMVESLAEVLMTSVYFGPGSHRDVGTEVVVFGFVGSYGQTRCLPVVDFEKRYKPILKKNYKLSKSKVD